MKHLIKFILKTILDLIANSTFFSKKVIVIISFIVKNLPDGNWKAYIYGLVNSIGWKPINLDAEIIKLGNDTQISLVPHIHEFDFCSLFWQKMNYETELYDLMSEKIKNYEVIIDIGANVGIFSMFAAKANPSASVYSFEPSFEAFYRLSENKKNNKVSNLSIFNAAVADKNSFLEFFEPEGHLTNGSLDVNFASIFDKEPKKRKVIGIDFTFLNELVKTSNKKILIKIDVEGAEYIVLNSLQNLILQYKPDIIIEVLSTYEKQLNSIEFLKANYKLFNITHNGLETKNAFSGNDVYRDYFLQPN